jgi:capsular exopolysaccharide synthesis family protein
LSVASPANSQYPRHDDLPGLPERDEPFPLLDYLQLLWFRKRLIIAVTMLAAIIGFVHVNELKSIYTASSSLMVGVPEARVLEIEQVLTRDFYGNDADAEIEILKSRSLAEKVINNLNLLGHEEFNPSLRTPEKRLLDFLKYLNPKNWIPASWKKSVREALRGEVEPAEVSPEERARSAMVRAVNIFLGKLDIRRIEFTNVIIISFRSLSPEMAARVANEIPEAYIVDQLQAKFDATRKATDWLMEQLGDLEQKVADSERAVEIYRDEYGLTKGAQTGLLSEQLSELNSQLIVARAARVEAENRLDQATRLLASRSEGVETNAEVLSSPLIQQLRNQEAQLLGRATELSVEYGPKHPRMLQVNAEIEDLQQRIETETEKLVLGLENELELARSREQGLEQSLSESESRAGMQNRQAIQLRALEREAAANRALFETFLSRFKETSSTQGMETSDSRIISAAEVPAGPTWPNRKRTFAVFVFMGFFAGCALVIGLNQLNPGLLSPEQVERDLGIHTIGVVPLLGSGETPYRHLLAKNSSVFIEALNSLKISLQLSDPDATARVIMVTSSVPEEGKSSLSVALAMMLAQGGKKVLLVDGDLRRTGLEKLFEIPRDAPGLTDLILEPGDRIEDFILPLPEAGIDFIRSGDPRNANATDIFSSHRMETIIAHLRERYDHVLLDSPPIMAVADARVIGKLADKTLFVVRWNKTPRKVARAALDLLLKSKTEIAGTILQQVDLSRYGRLGYGGSGYYYHYGRYAQYYHG